MSRIIPDGFEDRRVAVIGLGYVGLTLAVAMADIGFQVHGIELRQDVIDGLNRGEAHFWEPRLTEKLARVVNRGSLTFSSTFPVSDLPTVYIITVGTPLGENGRAQLKSVESVARQVGEHAPDGSLVILRSTVKLGTARNVVMSALNESGKTMQLAVCPERTLEGRALIELHELPQIIGANDAATRTRAMQLFNLVTRTTVAVRSLETAELVKLIDNTYRDITFAFANEIAELCGQAGISAVEVIRAGKLGYPRTNVPLPGPVGGPCLEKDPHILAESAMQWGVDMVIAKAGRAVNEAQPLRAARNILAWTKTKQDFTISPRIALLGFAFKGEPATDDLRGTMAFPILDALRLAFPNGVFLGHDPVVSPAAITKNFDVEVVTTLEDAFINADIAVFMNNHPNYRNAELGALSQFMAAQGLVYDFWNMFEDVEDSLRDGISMNSLGSELSQPWR